MKAHHGTRGYQFVDVFHFQCLDNERNDVNIETERVVGPDVTGFRESAMALKNQPRQNFKQFCNNNIQGMIFSEKPRPLENTWGKVCTDSGDHRRED